ncbi:hypothetical protein T484DRAFT_1902472 [Baffinella frigidus]|nr:hypothetical protein T484DRAFT_1902472 [Cryptophyta sp. CCMP2293]
MTQARLLAMEERVRGMRSAYALDEEDERFIALSRSARGGQAHLPGGNPHPSTSDDESQCRGSSHGRAATGETQDGSKERICSAATTPPSSPADESQCRDSSHARAATGHVLAVPRAASPETPHAA